MKQAITVAALLCAALSASADPVARGQNGDVAQLLDSACAADVVAVVPESLHSHLRAAIVVSGGKRYDACWLAIPSRGYVHLYFADGDQGAVPMADFKNEPGI
jgi:hypothetical protein